MVLYLKQWIFLFTTLSQLYLYHGYKAYPHCSKSSSQNKYNQTIVKAKYWSLAKYFHGYPKETDMIIEEEVLPPLKSGEFLAEAVYLSVDPYQRIFGSIPGETKLGETFMGLQIAKIVRSENNKYPVGKYVSGPFGWRSHTISNGEGGVSVLPDLGDLPVSLGIGILGVPGMTAYFGFLEICQPKKGETLVVTGAAGAVGSTVGQIAKIKGLTVIGIAGSDAKGKWLTEELGFDHFINYKTDNIDEKLRQVAPQGVDCYFDNVGGEISTTIIYNMNKFGRIAVCGYISAYNSLTKPKATIVQEAMVSSELKMEGFSGTSFIDQYPEGIKQNLEWIKEGKLKYQETVTKGFENVLKAFIGMLKGENRGKAVVKV